MLSSSHCRYEPRYPLGRPKATSASGHSRQIIAFDGIPEQIAGDEYVRVVDEDGIKIALNSDDPGEIAERIFRHGLAVAIGVDNLCCGCGAL